MTTWADIDRELQALRSQLPSLVADHGADALQAFAELCDPILERADLAGGDLGRAASARATEILLEAGLIDADEHQR